MQATNKPGHCAGFFYFLEFILLEVRVKLKAKSNLLERARTAWEAVARQVGETDFSRNPQTGEYLHPGVAMGWRIHKKNL
ncbi:hypothetical protein [Pseudomonas extremaustralis]